MPRAGQQARVVRVIVPALIQRDHSSVLGDKRLPLQAKLLLQGNNLCRGFTAAQHQGNLLASQARQPRPGGIPLMGVVIQQRAVEIGEND